MRKTLNIDSLIESLELYSNYDIDYRGHYITIDEEDLSFFVAEQIGHFTACLLRELKDEETES